MAAGEGSKVWKGRGRASKGSLRRRFLHLHEWIGLPVKVVASTSTFAGIEGVVVDETKNTIVIKTHRSIKRVPKEGSIVAFLVEGGQILLDVGKLRFRPEERLKRAKLSRWEYVVGGSE